MTTTKENIQNLFMLYDSNYYDFDQFKEKINQVDSIKHLDKF